MKSITNVNMNFGGISDVMKRCAALLGISFVTAV